VNCSNNNPSEAKCTILCISLFIVAAESFIYIHPQLTMLISILTELTV